MTARIEASVPSQAPRAEAAHAHAGLAWGLIGVVIFSLTLPFTRWAVAELDPTFVALGRAVVAGLLASLLLLFTRTPIPDRSALPALIGVSIGVVFGFPLASSWAMRSVPASHGAVVIGLLPLATALAGALRFGERPSLRFWAWAWAGSAVVVAFAIFDGLETGRGLAPQMGDVWLLVAVAFAAIGYAEGGKLAQRLGGWQTICWALVVSLPVLLPIVALLAPDQAQRLAEASPRAWLAMAYVSVFSMFVGFFAWYRGLATGGIARVGQVQLLQLFFTIAFSALAFGERVPASTWVFAIVVVGCVMAGRKAPIQRRI